MIVVNIATYPPRLRSLLDTIERLSNQVDRINVVLNEYQNPPDDLKKFDNVQPLIPDHDTKDTGKFFPDVSEAAWVFLCDDDIVYPDSYVRDSLREMAAISQPNFIGGYHGSIYRGPRLKKWSVSGLRRYFKERRRPVGELRDVIKIERACASPIVVDQLGTGVMVLKPDQMPPYDYVKTAQKFVDVRMARWCFERRILQICLPHEEGYMWGVDHEETIYRDFTKAHFPNVLAEICEFALKNPRAGRTVEAIRKE
jgi:hypothetical protein